MPRANVKSLWYAAPHPRCSFDRCAPGHYGPVESMTDTMSPSAGASRVSLTVVLLSASTLALWLLATPASAQSSRSARDSAARADSARARVTSLGQVTITATRTVRDVFDAPAAVSVIDSATLHNKLPNTAVDA